MRKILLLVFVIAASRSFAQTDSTGWLRAFPITDYMVDLNDSVKVVQLEMPDGWVVQDKQLGLVFGTYNGQREEAVQKGYGKCHLIKGNYFYFTIGHNESGVEIKKGDLLYTFMPKTSIYYGLFPKVAAHFIRLQSVYEKPFYDRYSIFSSWTEQDEQQLTDSVVADIQFTGKYFMEANPSMDKQIASGFYQGSKILSVMAECQPADLKRFLEYMIGHPRLYAGREWKISEVFATWLQNGAPDA